MPSSVRCCKPGCDDAAAARLTFDHGGATAWIDDPGGEGGWALCVDHAERLSVPVGWSRIDRRHPSVRPIPLAS